MQTFLPFSVTYPKRALLCLVLIIYVILSFWLGSRYPALGQKQIEGGLSEISSLQTMWPAFAVEASSPVVTRVYLKTLNWIIANLEGMKFGLLIGGLFLTLFNCVQVKTSYSSYKSSFLGFLIGSPMGVCVNCAAPLMRGLYGSKNLAFSLSAMLASPVFNVVVLSMLFGLFPRYIVLTKIGLNLFIVLVFIPWFVGSEDEKNTVSTFPNAINESWFQAIKALSWDGFKKILFIFFTSAPLMVLAGGLSVVVTEFVDFGSFLSGVPLIPALIGASILAVLLPMPMAFDLVVSYSLFTSGAPIAIVMAVLFGLGSYSIYTAMEIAREWSLRRSLQLSGAFVIIGVLAGLGTQFYHNSRYESFGLLTMDIQSSKVETLSQDDSQGFISAPSPFQSSTESESQGFLIKKFQLQETVGGESLFKKRDLSELGIDLEDNNLRPFAEPELGTQRGISVADFNNDGWQDIAIARTDGISFYINTGGTFQETRIPLLSDIKEPVLLLVAHDFDGNGLMDIAFSTYSGGFKILLTRSKDFSEVNLIEFSETVGRFVTAIAAEDLNGDGKLDLFLAVSSTGQFFKKKRVVNTGNLFYLSEGQNWTLQEGVPESRGETLAALFTDIDSDGNKELILANDFGLPSEVFRVLNSHPWLEAFQHQDLKGMPGSGMSIDSADLSRSDKLDFFISAGWSGGQNSLSKFSDLCETISPQYRETCLLRTMFREKFDPSIKRGIDFNICSDFKGHAKNECLAVLRLWTATSENKREFCIDDPNNFKKYICDNYFVFDEGQPSEKQHNAKLMGKSELYLRTDSGWMTAAKNYGLDMIGWSWDAKFADYDLDGWDDLLVTSGFLFSEVDDGNLNAVYFKNKGDGRLEQIENIGLEQSQMKSNFIKIDIDNDGDLDLIFVGTLEPLSVYENQSTQERISLEFIFDSKPAYGATIRLYRKSLTGLESVVKTEIKFSPGYMSHDGPRLTFGVAPGESIMGFEVVWPSGARQIFSNQLEMGYHYSVQQISN